MANSQSTKKNSKTNYTSYATSLSFSKSPYYSSFVDVFFINALKQKLISKKLLKKTKSRFSSFISSNVFLGLHNFSNCNQLSFLPDGDAILFKIFSKLW